ncbi:MAG: hypothetical protein U9R29_07600 [Thermodesulfobacteriota bacterium]|nr:hypothetical protein [Thermodesulfobacteriota bacterium]
MEVNPRIKMAVIEVVNTQVESNDPPETGLTLTRLINDGYTPSDAKDLIGCVVLSEVFDVMKNEEVFDPERYVAALNRLPEIPEDKI